MEIKTAYNSTLSQVFIQSIDIQLFKSIIPK